MFLKSSVSSTGSKPPRYSEVEKSAALHRVYRLLADLGREHLAAQESEVDDQNDGRETAGINGLVKHPDHP